jgi:F420-dependent oxidoreductase-like protein
LSNYRFGLVLPQGWRWLDDHGATAFEQYEFSKKIAQLADSLEFDSIYAYDHLWGGANLKSNRDKNFFECFTILSAIIETTKRIRIGQIVTCNSYRSPALVAKMLSTMDVISNGRVELGIGAGWYKEEYDAYGYDYPPPFIRIKQLEEALRIIKLMWTQDTATFQGEHYSIREAVCNPKPIQKPHPPIMVGGTGETHLLRTVAKHADRYNHPFAPVLDVRRRLSILKEHCRVLGRNHQEIERSIVIRCLIREDEDEIHKVVMEAKTEDESKEVFNERICAIVGTPEQVISRLYEYADEGITHFIMHFIGLNESSLKLFDSKVVKKLPYNEMSQ